MKNYPYRFKSPALEKLREIHNLLGRIGDVRFFFARLLCPELGHLNGQLAELTLEVGKVVGE